VREATAHFIRNHKQYFLTSGTTDYLPNPSEIAVVNTWHGPYQVLGNPYVDDKSQASYYSQISSVFKVPGTKEFYIVCADRWMPGLMNLKCETYRDLFIEITE
jgi:hypothetical protein